MYCRDCNYDLRGNTNGECPECGRLYDADQPNTFLTKPAPCYAARVIYRALSDALGLFVAVLCFIALIELYFLIMDLWFDTARYSLIFGYIRMSYGRWELDGPGHWMGTLLIVLLIAISLITGILFRRACRRHLLGDFDRL